VTNVAESTYKWCPDEGDGVYRWFVRVLRGSSKSPVGRQSTIGSFTWKGGPCGEQPKPEQPEKPTEKPDAPPPGR